MQFHQFSTDRCPVGQRLHFWNSVTSDALTWQIAEPLDPDTFAGRIRRADVGNICVAEVASTAARVTHSAAHVRQSGTSCFILRLPLSGELTVVQGSRETRLSPGDFTLCDVSQPYVMYMGIETSLLTIRIPRYRLERYMAEPEAYASLAIRGASAMGGLTSRFLQDFWRTTVDLTSAETAATLCEAALQMLATAFAELLGPGAPRINYANRHRIRITRYIEDHLAEFSLSPSSIAAGLNITKSYMHRLFSSSGDSVSRYILRRRLEECARSLSDPRCGGQSVSTIAVRHGFGNLSFFSRAFRAKFGTSPSGYRVHQAA